MLYEILKIIIIFTEKRLQGLTSWLDSIYGLHDEVQTRLAVAGMIVEEMRSAVFKQTGFQCSAGIAHNKVRVSTIKTILTFIYVCVCVLL